MFSKIICMLWLIFFLLYSYLAHFKSPIVFTKKPLRGLEKPPTSRNKACWWVIGGPVPKTQQSQCSYFPNFVDSRVSAFDLPPLPVPGSLMWHRRSPMLCWPILLILLWLPSASLSKRRLWAWASTQFDQLASYFCNRNPKLHTEWQSCHVRPKKISIKFEFQTTNKWFF